MISREWFLIGLLTGTTLCLAFPAIKSLLDCFIWYLKGFKRDESKLRRLARRVEIRRREEQLLASLEDLESGYIRPRTIYNDDGRKVKAYTPCLDEEKIMSGEEEPGYD